jgi:hypothetical protein
MQWIILIAVIVVGWFAIGAVADVEKILRYAVITRLDAVITRLDKLNEEIDALHKKVDSFDKYQGNQQ